MKYLKNDQLPLIRNDWPGNPFEGEEFKYVGKNFRPSWKKMLQWQLRPNPQRGAKKADDWRPAVTDNGSVHHSGSEDFITWLGHATFLCQLNGIRLITDPVLFDLPFIPRRVKPPFPVEEIRGIDYILLSHDHRDHCDKKTIQTLLRHNRPEKILTAMKMGEVIANWVGDTPIEEAAWYQQYHLPEGLEITFLPARHWCRRGLFDFNKRLWGSFLIRSGDTTIYFGADSGYAGHFEEIGRLMPDIDLALIGIGAYKPAYMMEEIHTSPADAFQAFKDLGARRLLPMHYGTYDLSDEPPSEPFRIIRELFEKADMQERLLLPAVGEGISVS